jgi:hypothetical protein
MVRTIPLFLIAGSILALAVFHSIFSVYGQAVNNQTSSNNGTLSSQFIVNIRGISSYTEPNMVALISTENDVQAKKVDVDKAIIESGQENSFSPSKMLDVTIQMNGPVKPNTEVMACVLQLGSTDFNQRVKCNTVFSQSGNTDEPQKIIVPL